MIKYHSTNICAFLNNLMKLSATIVLYNPDNKVIDNIKSYIANVDIIYVIDNSDTYNLELIEKIKKLEKVVYINNDGNKGIAQALNVGAKISLENNFKIMITLDQDSHPTNEMIENIKSFIFSNDIDKIGIISPFHKVTNHPEILFEKEFEEVEMIMTSGNFLNLDVYSKVGPFIEALFIDHVDHEYCLRLRKNGYKVIRLNNVIMEHELGAVRVIKILSKKREIVYHSPLRTYYFVRNLFYLKSKYKDFTISNPNFKTFIKENILFNLLFSENKITRVKMIIRGYIDYKRNKFGKFIR